MQETKLNQDQIKYFSKSVLCWLATVDINNEPNVSPKEMFLLDDRQKLLIANIASPNSIKNIKINNSVCVSLLDIYTQKGIKLKGKARIIDDKEVDFIDKYKLITGAFSEKFPFSSIIEIQIQKVENIFAPSYVLFPEETTEESQIQSAIKTYESKLDIS